MRRFGVVFAFVSVFVSGFVLALFVSTPSQRKKRIRSTPHTVKAPTIQPKPSMAEPDEQKLVELAEDIEFELQDEVEEPVELVESKEQEDSLNLQPIKGNRNSRGEKIYHIPGGQYYNRVNAIETFETPDEAEAAGYRKSLR